MELAMGQSGIAVDTFIDGKFNGPRKLEIASKRKSEIAISNSWLNQNLNMGNFITVSADCRLRPIEIKHSNNHSFGSRILQMAAAREPITE